MGYGYEGQALARNARSNLSKIWIGSRHCLNEQYSFNNKYVHQTSTSQDNARMHVTSDAKTTKTRAQRTVLVSSSYSAATVPFTQGGATTRTVRMECCFVSQPLLQHATAAMTQAKQKQSDRCTFQDGVGAQSAWGAGLCDAGRSTRCFSTGCTKIASDAIEVR